MADARSLRQPSQRLITAAWVHAASAAALAVEVTPADEVGALAVAHIRALLADVPDVQRLHAIDAIGRALGIGGSDARSAR